MKKVRLGRQGPWVSKICFGSLAVSPLQGRVSLDEGRDVFRYACVQGIDWVDTAEIYGNYEQLAPVLAEFPHVRVVSKSYAVTAEEMERSLEAARRGLGRDFIDIFLLHEQEGVLTLRGHEKAWMKLCRAQQTGEVGWIGMSTHTVNGVREGCLFPGMQIIHPILNYAGIGIVGGGVEEMLSAIRLAHEVGVGIYAMKVFGGGHLGVRGVEGRDEKGNEGFRCAALDFVMGLDEVPAMALGMSSRAEVDFNIRYVAGLPVEGPLIDRVGGVARRLHVADWCEGCGRCLAYCPSRALSLTEGPACGERGGRGEQRRGEQGMGEERERRQEGAGQVKVDQELCVLCGYCGRGCPHFCLKIV